MRLCDVLGLGETQDGIVLNVIGEFLVSAGYCLKATLKLPNIQPSFFQGHVDIQRIED